MYSTNVRVVRTETFHPVRRDRVWKTYLKLRFPVSCHQIPTIKRFQYFALHIEFGFLVQLRRRSTTPSPDGERPYLGLALVGRALPACFQQVATSRAVRTWLRHF